MRFIGAGIGQADLEGRDQFKEDVGIAAVVQVDLAKLHVVLRADPHRGVRANVRPCGVKTDAVGVEGAAVLGLGVGRGVLGDGRQRVARRQAQVEKTAQGVAQRVVPTAIDVQATPAAGACPVGAQGDAVAAIAQHMRGLDGTGARHDVTQGPGRAALQCRQGVLRQAGGHVDVRRHFTRWAFMQQRRHRLQLRVGHAPALRQPVKQYVGHRHDAHALVVGHEGAHRRERSVAIKSGGGIVQRLDEAITLPGALHRHALQVLQRPPWHQLAGHDRGVRRHDTLFGRCAAQRQVRHPLRRVLVGQAAVARRIGRFRHAPGQLLLKTELNLLDHGRL